MYSLIIAMAVSIPSGPFNRPTVSSGCSGTYLPAPAQVQHAVVYAPQSTGCTGSIPTGFAPIQRLRNVGAAPVRGLLKRIFAKFPHPFRGEETAAGYAVESVAPLNTVAGASPAPAAVQYMQVCNGRTCYWVAVPPAATYAVPPPVKP